MTTPPINIDRASSTALGVDAQRFSTPQRMSQLEETFASGATADTQTRDLRAQLLSELHIWAKRSCGLSFSEEQYPMFAAKVDALCRDLRVDLLAVVTKLRNADPDTALRVAEALSTNYTYFRREPEAFDYLMRHVFPRLPEGQVRVWSAATSSGDEAYSIAMAAHEYFGAAALARVRILGTDLSERQLRLAEQGIYPQDQVARLDENRRNQWFRPVSDGRLQVDSALRQMCTFRRLNLTQEHWPFENGFHVIFLRNILYYFEPKLRRQVLEMCFDAAEDGAVLITSLTEPLISVQTRWRQIRPAIFVRERR